MSLRVPASAPQLRMMVDRERLCKLLGMLGSAHDGEIAAAGRADDALVRRAGLTWAAIIAPPQLPVPVSDIGDETSFASTREALEFCLRYQAGLTDWEISFCRSLWRQRKPATAKQVAVLQAIVAKVLL